MDRVLVLEDDPDMRGMLALLLTQEGYEVHAVGTGAEALELARGKSFELMVTDIRMDGMDGLETLAKVRQEQPEARSLVITGYSTEADSIRAIRLGVGDYLKKPFDLNEFLGSVRRLVRERRQENVRREREERLRASLVKSLEALARVLEPSLVEAGRLARRLGEAVGLSGEALSDAQLATLIARLTELDAYEPHPDDLPASLNLTLRHLDEHWDGSGGPDGLQGSDIPLASRLVAVVRAELDPHLRQELETVKIERPARRSVPGDGRLDPEIVAAFLSLGPEGAPRVDPGWRWRGMLSLGRALEEGRDLAAAEQAYQELSGVRSPEGVEAQLGLARLARRQGQPAEACQHARQALTLVAGLAPVHRAQSTLRASLMLSQLKDPEALTWLERAARMARDLHDRAGEALALLGAWQSGYAAGPERLIPAVETLLAAEFAGDLAGASGWLLGPLLELSAATSAAPLERALAQLARDVPREYLRLVQQQGLTVAARRSAARALGSTGSPLAQEVMRLLATDAAPEVREEVSKAQTRQPGQQRQPPLLRIYTMGPLEVFKGEERIGDKAWRSQKSRYLFAFLAAHKARPVSEDVLIDHFWEDDFEKGKRNLYWCCSILRSLLRPEGWTEELDYIQRSGGSLNLNPDLPRWHDMEKLEEHLDCAASVPAEAADHYRRALQLYRAPFLESCYQDWTSPIRERLALKMQAGLAWLATWARGESRHAEALDYCQRLLVLDPCHQEASEGALTALLALGRPQDAVRQFESIRRALDEELGMEPSLRLLRLHQEALSAG